MKTLDTINMSNWQTLVPGEIWWCDEFLDTTTYDLIIESINNSEHSELDGATRKHAVGETYYNYNVVKTNVRKNRPLVDEVFRKLNQLFVSLGDDPIDYSGDLGYLQFFAKSFNSSSKYDLHAETRGMFGKYVFVNYLSDETSGELVFPDEQLADQFVADHPENKTGWEQTKITCAAENNPIRYIGPLTILPKKNSCIVFTTGTAHYVNTVTSSDNKVVRPSLSGWVSATDAYVNWYKQNSIA